MERTKRSRARPLIAAASNCLKEYTITDRIELRLTDPSAGCASSSSTEVSGTVTAAVSGDALVSGTTCSHCVTSVSEELSALDGVESVTVELNADGPSRVTLRSDAPLARAAFRAAVEEAGYTLTTSPA